MSIQVSRHYLMRCPEESEADSGLLFSIKVEGPPEEIARYPDTLEKVECLNCHGRHDAMGVPESQYAREFVEAVINNEVADYEEDADDPLRKVGPDGLRHYDCPAGEGGEPCRCGARALANGPL